MKIVLDAGHGFNTPGKRVPDGSMHEYEFNRVVAHYASIFLEEYVGIETRFTHSDKYDVSLKDRTDAANKWGADLFVSIHANAQFDVWSEANGVETYAYVTMPKEAMGVAAAVQNEMVILTGLRNRGVKTADFHVLRESKMTAILCECAFMSNRHEAELLKTDYFRKTCAIAITRGIAKFYQLKPIKQKEGNRNMEAWKIETAKKAIEGLHRKGLLEDEELWKNKLETGEIMDELPWLMLTLFDRIAK
ncbi:N-acetylmuramoyl-L-alanine amidase [Paenibacillus chitinolyticus]|uniref:N-acetylmuramoyl-L-alanine amidase n=1 Tax=Paenibacillus chitinolyticus TaxID=79263 RepID=UPI0036513662